MSRPPEHVNVRLMAPADIRNAAHLVAEVFTRDVAPSYKAEGVSEFLRYAAPEALVARSLQGHVALVADDQRHELVGVAEVRDFSHISLLFVQGVKQRQGIGRALVSRAVQLCRDRNPGGTTITVNASPNSVGAYERYGFVSTGLEQERNGIRFVPMALAIDSKGDG
jgi:GNAT superfamily N-acetyltransferase